MTRYIRTEGDRDPFIRKGYYWICFGHLFSVNASEDFKKRMLKLKDEDEKTAIKKYSGG